MLIANCTQGDIFDPFLGSGTTLIAAEQLGRKCYGIEISPAYCDVIVKRWEKLTGNKATLEMKNG
jgi:DNA modification methylase